MKIKKRITMTGPAPARSGRLPESWKSHPFLHGLSAEHLATLEHCAMQTDFKLGQVIFREGELANRFYLILNGRVALAATAPERGPVLVDELSGGDVLGWSWLFPPYGLHFAAEAVEPTQAIFFYGTWLRERCEENPALGYELTQRAAAILIRRLETLARQKLQWVG